ncbi:MAG: hypothetical protein K6C30_00580 [Bacteroidaceae bacterium]|nr:hypothetical protein [Bacteroidaceae bacterium]
MKRKHFTFAELRNSQEAESWKQVTAGKVHSRRKVNCLCRATPRQGVVNLHPDLARRLYNERLHNILASDNPGTIGTRAIRAGELLVRVGRPVLALRLMKHALSHLISADSLRQEDYVSQHYWPGYEYEQWYEYWSWRISDADAYELASHIDRLSNELNQQLGHPEKSHQRARVKNDYDSLFEYLYEY